MKFRPYRLMRSAAMLLFVAWVVFVIHTFLSLNEKSNDLVLKGQLAKDNLREGDVVDMSVKKDNPGKNQVEDKENNEGDEENEDESKKKEPNIQPDPLRVVLPPDVKGDSDVVDDIQKEVDDIDSYDDVTYPPFVETLPSGAVGQGPKGLGVVKSELSPEERKEYEEKYKKNSFNQYSSDRIPVHRELPDYRSKECVAKEYPSALPNVSVVIIFHNEAWSVLLRSVHSILDRTDPRLLVEIILVDDFSSMEHLKRPLDKYFRNYPKVKIIRAPVRGGLTKARLLGFDRSTGEVVVFLDSHTECTPEWAEPMLWMISKDYRTVPFPMIDSITANSLTYDGRASSRSPYGIFSMNTLTFRWNSALKRQTMPVTDPKPSPTMPGGLFAISRKWFIELGKYDPALLFWGGENMELSFKAWMCGGSVVIADCSHIGHIFRTSNPIKWTTSLGNSNYVRVAMVWMDEYKNYYLERIRYNVGDYGDISERLAIRKRLKCHSFGWYVDNVYPELKEQIVLEATYAGEFRNVPSNLCLDAMAVQEKGPQLYNCHHQGGNQYFYFREDKYLQYETRYVCKTEKDSVSFCSQPQEWFYNTKTQQLIHVDSKQCMQKSTSQEKPRIILLAPCKDNSSFQKWVLERRAPFKYR